MNADHLKRTQTRNPMKPYRDSDTNSKRLAERQPQDSTSQEPPRTTQFLFSFMFEHHCHTFPSK